MGEVRRVADAFAAGGWILSFDTSEDFGSIALARLEPTLEASRVLKRRINERRQQASKLIPKISDVLAEADIAVSDLSGVVVGAGPGSFTGVRVAASTAKGLVFGRDIPLWTPSSLLGAALNPHWERAPVRAVAFDARGDRIYGAIYEIRRGGHVAPILEPHAGTIHSFLEQVREAGAQLAGSAAERHGPAATSAGIQLRSDVTGEPSAEGLIRALALDPDRRATENPKDFEPTYLRGSSAVAPPTPKTP